MVLTEFGAAEAGKVAFRLIGACVSVRIAVFVIDPLCQKALVKNVPSGRRICLLVM